MSIVCLKAHYDRVLSEYDIFVKDVQKACTDEAMQAFLTDPKSIYFQSHSHRREESLMNQWNDKLHHAQESVNRKWREMNIARTAYLLESQFQREHANVNTLVSVEGLDMILCGYYKVVVIVSREGPTHYEFILKRSTHVLGDEIPSKVIVPLSTMTGVGVWQDVTPKKINFVSDDSSDDSSDEYSDEYSD